MESRRVDGTFNVSAVCEGVALSDAIVLYPVEHPRAVKETEEIY
jgi:hypothetical protein